MTEKGIDNVAFDNTSENVNISKPKQSNGNTLKGTASTGEIVCKVESDEEDHGPHRPTWGHGTEFLMSCISMSVGLGNIWRFPFTAYENGGGAFLIPYVIVLLLIGKPFYYLEMALGQFTSKASVKALQTVPIMKGVAIGQQIGTTCIVTYYCSLIALTLFYMIKSFSAQLPWAECWPSWNDVKCIDAKSNIAMANRTGAVSSSELYFLREVIKQKNDISDGIGFPDWQLALWLLLAWILVYLVIIKGVKSSGKISYFLAMFPYVVMIILLIRACTLEGAIDGIRYFVTPDFNKLLQPQVWYQATTQLFFSLSVGIGSIVMFSSFNTFDHNIYRDALIVTSLDTFTSLLGGFTIFGILGNLAYNIGEKDIGNVVKSGGSGLAFISYPEAISKFTFVPQLFSVLFFFMLFVLGVGSAVGLQSSIVTNLKDFFPKVKQWQMAGVCCLIGFLVGILYVTPGGQWMLTMVDHFGGTFLIFALAILELVGIFWVYGLENFCWDLEFMLKRKVTPFWRISWGIITPGFMIIIFGYFLLKLENPTFMGLQYPESSLIAGWAIFGVGLAQIFIWGAWLATRDAFGEKKSAIKVLFSKNPDWGPKSPIIRRQWKDFKEDKMQQRMMQSIGHSRIKQIVWMLLRKYD